jgi:hypothetical protein
MKCKANGPKHAREESHPISLDNPRLAHYSFGFLTNPASHLVRISLLKLRQEQLYR